MFSSEPQTAINNKASPPLFWGSPRHALMMLIAATCFWGLSFPLTKYWQVNTVDCPGGAILSSLTLLAIRTVPALVVLAIFKPHLFVLADRRALLIGSFLGSINFLGCFFQILGLATTTPTLSGFFTSLASAWVPLLALVCFRISVAPATLVGICVGIAGAGVLEIDTSGPLVLGMGEGLSLLCSVMFALVILLLDRLGRRVESSHLTVGFVGMTGLPALVLAPIWAQREAVLGPWMSWLGAVLQTPGLLLDVALLTLLCTVLAYHWMTTYQPRVPASRAALVYLIEPLFAATFSVAWGYDAITLRLILGGGLILGGNFLVELPAWLPRYQKAG